MCSCFDVNMVAEHIMNVLVPLIMEEIVGVIKVVLLERISERIRERIVDVHVPRAVEQVTEVAKTKEISVLAKTIGEQTVRVETLAVEVEKMRSELFEAERALLANPFAKVKGLITCLINRLQAEAPSEMSHTSCRDGETSMATEKEDLEVDITKHSSELEVLKIPSRDRILQRAADQILDVLVLEKVKQLVEVPKTVSHDVIQQQTAEQIVDVPVPHVEELMEVSKDFAQDRVQRRFAEQTIENPAISSAVKIIEVPVIRTQEKTQQLVNTHVQHVVNTVEVEKPKLIRRQCRERSPSSRRRSTR